MPAPWRLRRGDLGHCSSCNPIDLTDTTHFLPAYVQFMENGALSNIIKPSRFGCFPEPLVAMYISQVTISAVVACLTIR